MSMRSGWLTAAVVVAVLACVLVGCGKRPDDELALELWAQTAENIQAHNYDQALETAQQAVAEAPKSYLSWWALGKARARLKQYEEAEEALRKAIALAPDKPRPYTDLASVLGFLGQSDAREAPLRKAVELAPDIARPHWDLASWLLRQKRLDEAEEEARKALDLDPSFRSRDLYARIILGQKRYREALEQFRALSKARPEDANMRAYAANALMKLEQYDEAIAEFERAAELNPENGSIARDLGRSLRAADRPEEAEAQFRRALELAPDDALARTSLGGLLQNRDEWAAAEQQFRLAVEAAPDKAPPRVWLAGALLRQGGRDEAVTQYRAAIEADPESIWTVDYVSGGLLTAGKVDEALAVIRDSDQRVSEEDRPHLTLLLVDALTYAGELAEARERLQEAASEGEQDRRYTQDLAFDWIRLDDSENAIAAARRAFTMAPDNEACQRVLGEALAFAGRCDSAERLLRDALKQRPNNTTTRALLAYCLARQGKDAGAREQLAAIGEELTRSYLNIVVYYSAGLAWRELGDTEKSNALFQRAIDRWPKHPWSVKMREMMQAPEPGGERG